MIMTIAEQLRQRGYIEGYLASYATSYASSAALAVADQEFRDYFLEKKKATPLTTLLEQKLQEGIRSGLLSLLQDKNIDSGAIAEAIGWCKEDVEKMQKEASPSSP
ncbi:MAG: hypothetical protein AAF392_02440 [Bacteroidota bacterium]